MSTHPNAAHAPHRDAGGFEELYREWRHPVVGLCRRWLGDRHDVEAVAQEVFLRAWLSWDRFAVDRPFGPWVVTIARRLCMNELRRSGRRVEVSDDLTCESPAVLYEQDFDRVAQAELIARALEPLPARYQRLLMLREGEGWSYEAIAAFEGVTTDSVKGLLRRARTVLRRLHGSVTEGLPAALGIGGGMLQRALARISRAAERAGAAVVGRASGCEALVVALVVILPAAAPPLGATGAAGAGTRPAPVAAAEVPPVGAAEVVVARPRSTTPAATGTGAPSDPEPADDRAGRPFAVGEPRVTPAAEGTAYRFTASPAYEEDRTVFAAGAAHRCPVVSRSCGVVLKSTDAGQTWTRLGSEGAQPGRVLLPPSYPRDPRIFLVSSTTLSVSTDEGATFALLTAVPGEAAMSPLFSEGDPRIFFGFQQSDAGHLPLAYRDGELALSPLHLPLPPGATPRYVVPGSQYADDGTVFVSVDQVGDQSRLDPTLGRFGRVYACTLAACTLALDEGSKAPSLVWSKRWPQAVFAWTTFSFLRSTDGARSFERTPGPFQTGNVLLQKLTAAPDGRLVAMMNKPGDLRTELWSSDDNAETWSLLSSATAYFGSELEILPDGVFLASPPQWAGAGIHCSTDGGRTWLPACDRPPAPESRS